MLEEKIEEAIRTELTRQADSRSGDLKVRDTDGGLEVNGTIDMTALAAAIAGAVAGGP